MTPALENYINGWLAKAENDLLSAQRLLEIEPRILDTACFHCQQAIEKNLKAFLAFKGVAIEHTHNIVYLLAKCADFDNVFKDIDPKNIDVFAVQARYPDFAELPELSEAQDHFQLALRIKGIVNERMVISKNLDIKDLPETTKELLKNIEANKGIDFGNTNDARQTPKR